MKKLVAFATLSIVCATPALSSADRPDRGCGGDPETTGSLHAEAPGLHPRLGKPRGVEVTPPEESWQAEFSEDAEQRRRDLLACGVD